MIFLCNKIIEYLFWPFPDNLTKYLIKKVIGTFLILTVYILLFSHITACIFIYTEKKALAQDTDIEEPMTRYISAIYFMVTTSTSVGYGDILIDHQATRYIAARYMYQVFLMLLSLVVNSVFYSMINMTVNDAVYILDKMQQSLEDFDYFLSGKLKKMKACPEVNKFYKQNTTNFSFSYNYNLQIWVWYLTFMDQIPHSWYSIIKTYTSSDLYSKFALYFQPLTPAISEALIFAMQPLSFLKDDVIVQRREPFPGLYFIIDGEVRVYFRSKANTLYFKANGDDFGDCCLLGHNSHFSYVCETNVLAMFIPKHAVDLALELSPKSKQLLTVRARMKTRKFKNLLTRALLVRSKLNPPTRRKAVMNQALPLPVVSQPADVTAMPVELFDDKGSSSGSGKSLDMAHKSNVSHDNKQSNHHQTTLHRRNIAGKGSESSLSEAKALIMNKKKIANSQIAPVNKSAVSSRDNKYLIIGKNFDLLDIINNNIYIEPESANKTKISSNPFIRLTDAIMSSSSQGQGKLIRANSVDLKAQESVTSKMETLIMALTGTISKDRDMRQPGRVEPAKQTLLQKELLVANKKTLAKERVRDFSVSLHKSCLKLEYNEMINKKGEKKLGKANQLKSMIKQFREAPMDQSLAESTEEECGENVR